MAGGYKSFFAFWLGRAGAILSTGDTCREAVATIMRNTTVAALGVMASTAVPSQGPMTNSLPVMSEMDNATVPSSGAMANATVPATGAMTNSLPVLGEMRNSVVASQGAMSNLPVGAEADLC